MDFLERNVIVVGLFLLLGGSGAFAGFAGCKAKTRDAAFATAGIGLLFALGCVGLGWLQREALLRAAAETKTVAGLSRADRARIVSDKLADARAALGTSLAVVMAPLGASALAVRRGRRLGS